PPPPPHFPYTTLFRSQRGRQGCWRNLRGRYGRVAWDRSLLVDGHVGGADVVPELILRRVALEEAIEIGVSRSEGAAVVLGFESTDRKSTRLNSSHLVI